jgi:Erv1 / Alr family
MVSPAEWGPTTWELLHGIAERVGNQQSLTLIRDEKNEIRLALRKLTALLPCQKCQVHYRDWIRRNPPEPLLDRGGEYLQDALRDWVFRLHEDVNQRREVNSGITIDSLRGTYLSINLRANASILKGFYKRGIETRIFKPDEWKDAWKHLDLLLRFIGV